MDSSNPGEKSKRRREQAPNGERLDVWEGKRGGESEERARRGGKEERGPPPREMKPAAIGWPAALGFRTAGGLLSTCYSVHVLI